MKHIKIHRYKDGKLESVQDPIAEESIAHIDINNQVSFDTIISPVGTKNDNDIKSFVYGNLFTEGFIRSKSEVLKFQEKHRGDIINISVELKNFKARKRFLARNYNIIWTECGSLPGLERPLDKLEKLDLKIKLDPDDLFQIHEQVKDKTTLFKETGAYHYAFMFTSSLKLIDYACDIGRHNAVDKVIGKQLLGQAGDEADIFQDKILYTTGRISSDIVLKCLRAGLPVLISRAASFKTAIELARKYNLGLIGFLRHGAKRFNVYSNEEIFANR